jgi:hypothetical protein
MMTRQLAYGAGNKKLAIFLISHFLLIGLGVAPVNATISGDVAAGLPMHQMVANALAAGLGIDAMVSQALAAGVDGVAVAQAALAQPGANPQAVFSAMLANNVPLATVMNIAVAADQLNAATQAAINAGISNATIANAAVAAGAPQAAVITALANAGASLPPAFAFAVKAAPPGPPPGLHPGPHPGSSGTGSIGGGSGGGGRGGTASPSR